MEVVTADLCCLVHQMPRFSRAVRGMATLPVVQPTDQPPHHNRFMALFPGPPGWAGARRKLLDLWCRRGLTEADTLTIRLGATPCGLTSAHLHHPHFFTGRMPFLPTNH